MIHSLHTHIVDDYYTSVIFHSSYWCGYISISQFLLASSIFPCISKKLKEAASDWWHALHWWKEDGNWFSGLKRYYHFSFLNMEPEEVMEALYSFLAFWPFLWFWISHHTTQWHITHNFSQILNFTARHISPQDFTIYYHACLGQYVLSITWYSIYIIYWFAFSGFSFSLPLKIFIADLYMDTIFDSVFSLA